MVDIGDYQIEIQCPRCDFYNPIFIKQARLRDVVICRGCKNNIQLDDHMNQVRKAERDVKKQFEQLFDSLGDITIKISL
jgi:phage FluMu protein Com